MNIIFVPESFSYSKVTLNAGQMTATDIYNDPFDSVRRFYNSWGDYYSPVEKIIHESFKREYFWGRDDFMQLLRTTCEEDVYIKQGIELALLFCSDNDSNNFTNAYTTRMEWIELGTDLRPYVTAWVATQGNPEHKIFNAGISKIKIVFRDPMFNTLARTKFLNTGPNDHPNTLPETTADQLDDMPF